MLRKRLIARLDIKSPNLVKTIRLEGLRIIGEPHQYATLYDSQGIDEIVFLDIVASLYGRNSIVDLVSKTTGDVFIPVTVGGGIRSTDDVRELLNAGADKTAINTGAVKRPELIREIAGKFGSQCMVLQIDAKRHKDNWQAWTDGGRESSGLDVIEWAKQGVSLGAGEIFLTSIDQEGTRLGCDVDLIKKVSAAVSVPVVASGGIGNEDHVVSAFKNGADGVAMAYVLHNKSIALGSIRKTVHEAGFPVRMG